MDTNTKGQPLDARCRAVHPEHIVVGNKTFERDDVTARRFGVSTRTQTRGDAQGAPYRFFGGVKYRPLPDYDDFVLRGITIDKPPAPKRRSKR
jgi:hypothetical protein